LYNLSKFVWEGTWEQCSVSNRQRHDEAEPHLE
jgi:hypothetical protein